MSCIKVKRGSRKFVCDECKSGFFATPKEMRKKVKCPSCGCGRCEISDLGRDAIAEFNAKAAEVIGSLEEHGTGSIAMGT